MKNLSRLGRNNNRFVQVHKANVNGCKAVRHRCQITDAAIGTIAKDAKILARFPVDQSRLNCSIGAPIRGHKNGGINHRVPRLSECEEPNQRKSVQIQDTTN